jgi:hypothetical protein
MDLGDNGGDLSSGFGDEGQFQKKRPRELPDDLPKSLDDRKSVPSHYTAETEMYDAWQGRKGSCRHRKPANSVQASLNF